MNEEYLKVVTQLGRPVPGQSLTTDPSTPAPYEQPPEFTSVHKASEYLFEKLIEEETYIQVMGLLLDDMPIMEIVQTLLFTGFTEGKWSPDLMLMLVEPVAYMLLALSERAEIEPVIYRDEDEEDAAEEKALGTTFEAEKLQRMKKFLRTGIAPINTLTPEMLQQIETLPEGMPEAPTEVPTEAPVTEAPSLLAPPPPTEEEVQ